MMGKNIQNDKKLYDICDELINMSKEQSKSPWFKSWFDSKWYHKLYQHRDEQEAVHFIDNLLNFLKLSGDEEVLDMACGKGRHAQYLAAKGFLVTGLDLSENSIKLAQQKEGPNLSYFVHDMREPFRVNSFDVVFNFFTSFGYFNTAEEHLKTLEYVNRNLKPGGTFVLDFLNVEFAKATMIHEERIVRDQQVFHIRREFTGSHFVKSINFAVEDEEQVAIEKVRAFTIHNFKEMLSKAGFSVAHQFGNYDLDSFNEQRSPRLVVIATKN